MSVSKVWDGRLRHEIYELHRLVQVVALSPYLARLRRPSRILQDSKRPLKVRFGPAATTTSFWLRWKHTLTDSESTDMGWKIDASIFVKDAERAWHLAMLTNRLHFVT